MNIKFPHYIYNGDVFEAKGKRFVATSYRILYSQAELDEFYMTHIEPNLK